jgi:hypothetical protein
MGMMAGTCAVLMTTGSGGCQMDGEPCMGCGNCCSRTCAPTVTGAHACTPASGCRLIGDLCTKDADCCGGANHGLPGAGTVTCNIAAGTTPPVGTCSNPTGCDPEGDVCGLAQGTNTCGNSRHDCCNCMPPKINCCKIDRSGVPRCYTIGACIPSGGVCTNSSECCMGLPCVPDNAGVLHCGTACIPPGGVCTATSDCCQGLTCNVPGGKTSGTCGTVQVPTDGGVIMCPLIGQSCSTTNPCCTGLNCSPPTGTGTCAAGEMDCTCVNTIG